MSRYSSRPAASAYHSEYDSDDDTLVASRAPPRSTYSRSPRRSRYCSPSLSSYDSRSRSPPIRSNQGGPHTKRHGKYDTLGKASIAVGILQLVAGVLQLWSTRKAAKKDEEERSKRQRDFSQRKRERRREEDRWARQREWDRRRDEERDLTRARPMGRIGYAPSSRAPSTRAASRVSRGRTIESSPQPTTIVGEDYDDVDGRDYRRAARSRSRRPD